MSPFEIERQESPHTRIKVIGVGGAGTNAVDFMLNSDMANVDFAVVNTDARVLERSACPSALHIGDEVTHGLGCGGNPELGAQSAEASREMLEAALENTDMLFLSSGMGGGTGTGASPVISRMAQEKGILTVGIVTKPFRFEGRKRMRIAEQGIRQLKDNVDTLIVISNDRLLEVVGRKTSLVEAFAVTNDVLTQSVKSIANLIATPGLINVDFADIHTIMSAKGGAVMGVASAKGENRASEAIKKASTSSLLDKMAIDGAKGVLVCITGGSDLTLYEIDEAMSSIYDSIDEDADVIFGAVIDEQAGDEIQVTLIATGFEVEDQITPPRPSRRGAPTPAEPDPAPPAPDPTEPATPPATETPGPEASAGASDSALVSITTAQAPRPTETPQDIGSQPTPPPSEPTPPEPTPPEPTPPGPMSPPPIEGQPGLVTSATPVPPPAGPAMMGDPIENPAEAGSPPPVVEPPSNPPMSAPSAQAPGSPEGAGSPPPPVAEPSVALEGYAGEAARPEESDSEERLITALTDSRVTGPGSYPHHEGVVGPIAVPSPETAEPPAAQTGPEPAETAEQGPELEESAPPADSAPQQPTPMGDGGAEIQAGDQSPETTESQEPPKIPGTEKAPVRAEGATPPAATTPEGDRSAALKRKLAEMMAKQGNANAAQNKPAPPPPPPPPANPNEEDEENGFAVVE